MLETLRRSLVFACLALGSACSQGEHEGAPYLGDTGGRGADQPIPTVDPCQTPNAGCPCEQPDQLVDCGQVERRSADYVSCSLGQRTCSAENRWGECIGDRIATLSAPAAGQGARGLGTPQACSDNPCDPYCQRVVDDSADLALDGGPFTVDGGVTLKADVPLAVASTCTGLALSPASQDVVITATRSAFIKGEYFNRIDKTITSIPSSWTATATRYEATLDNDYAGAAPGPAGIAATNWSARWTGSIIPSTSEAYTFYTATDDGVRLWINGALVIDHWQDQGTTEYASPSIQLSAGNPALFRLEYYQGGGGSAAFLRWSSPTLPKNVVPSSNLGGPDGKRERLSLSPGTPTFSASLTPAGCFSGVWAAAWSLDRYDVATVNDGTVNLISGVPGPLTVTAYVGQFSASARINVTVQTLDTSAAPVNAVSNFGKPAAGADPMTLLYPYDNTVLPIGLAPPVLQWDSGGTSASAVKVSLRYPATGTPSFSWDEILAESNPPRATIPQAVWKEFENTGKGKDVRIQVQRVLGSVPALAEGRVLHFSSAPVRGLIYYTQYNRGGSTNMMVADPGSTSGARPAFASVDGCPVCHSVSANGNYFATADRRWSTTNGGLSTIQPGGLVSPIADFVPSPARDRYQVGSSDWRGFAWSPLTPDGSLALAANNIFGNTRQSVVGIDATTRTVSAPSTLQSGGTGTGLLAKYFPNTTFTPASPLWKRIDPIVAFDFAKASPGGLVPPDYSVRRTGQIQAFTSEPYTFQIDTSDGVKLLVNGTTVIDKLSYQGALTSFTGTVNMTAGVPVSIQLDQLDSSKESSIALFWSSPSVPRMLVPETQLYPSDGTHGLDVSYYANDAFSPPVAVQRLEPDVYADWGSNSPASDSSLPSDNFSETWLGQLESPYTGDVVLCIDANDSAQVTVGGNVVLNVGVVNNACSASLPMVQGTLYPLRIDHIEKASRALLKLRWQYGGLVERIPTANWYAPASYAPPASGLTASYYSDPTFNASLAESPALQASFTRYDANIDFDYGTGRNEYSQLSSSDNLSTRWTGRLQAPCSGVYEFQSNGNVDDGGRLWLDQLRVANTGSNAPLYGATYLDAGDHDFKFDWYESSGSAQIRLQWKVNCAGAGWATIPSAAFKPSGDVNRSGMTRDGGDNGNDSNYAVWQTPQTSSSSPLDVTAASPGVWGLGSTAMMVPSFSPDGRKLVFVDGDSSAGAGWRKGLSTFDFDQANRLFKRRRLLVNTWPLGDALKWPTFESDSRSIIYQSTVPADLCCRNSWTTYGYMAPTNYYEDPGKLWSIDAEAASPTPVALTRLNSGERAVDANKAYQATVSPRAAGGYRWAVFTSTRPYGNTINVASVQSDYSNTKSYAPMLNYTQLQSQLWVSAIDDTPSAGTDRSHPGFWLPNQNYSLNAGSGYINERGFWVLDGCKASGSGNASSCEVDEDCCGGLTSPKTSLCRLDTPVSDPPTRHCGAAPPAGLCVAAGGSCAATPECCLGSLCLSGTCSPPPTILTLAPANYERTYQATCDTGANIVWRFFDWKTKTPNKNSKIEFYAQTSLTGTDFASLPKYPEPVSTPGVVALGTAKGPPNANWVGTDVGASLKAAGFKSRPYLKVTMRLVPNDELSASPTLTHWRQNYSCVPAE